MVLVPFESSEAQILSLPLLVLCDGRESTHQQTKLEGNITAAVESSMTVSPVTNNRVMSFLQFVSVQLKLSSIRLI
jgi:hypothetical protein